MEGFPSHNAYEELGGFLKLRENKAPGLENGAKDVGKKAGVASSPSQAEGPGPEPGSALAAAEENVSGTGGNRVTSEGLRRYFSVAGVASGVLEGLCYCQGPWAPGPSPAIAEGHWVERHLGEAGGRGELKDPCLPECGWG